MDVHATSPEMPNQRAEAVRLGKWPAQVAASQGAIQPDLHGPQRNDPAEGIPTHAYSPFDERRNREYPCPPGGCDFETGHVLVKLAPGVAVAPPSQQESGQFTGDAALDAALSSQGIVRLEPIFPTTEPPQPGEQIMDPDGQAVPKPDLTRWYLAAFESSTADVYAAVEALAKAPGVAWAEPDYLRKPVGDLTGTGTLGDPEELGVLAEPSRAPEFTDPLYGQQWHLGAIHAPEAWAYLQSQSLPPGGSSDIIVAVIDTGVDYTHPDLAANMWVNAPEFSGVTGVDDDGNGYVDDKYGADMVTPDGNPVDDHGHGTHVAGIIAAQADNGIGGVGVAYTSRIMALKAAQYSGVLASSDIAEAIYYAVEKGADVINMSFGGYTRSQVEEDALAVAFGQAVLVAAAGNDGKANLPCLFGRDMYPAAYNWVLGVMASKQIPDLLGWRAAFSNYDCQPHDSHEYELLAPGVEIWSTLPQSQYAAWAGTSMAAPVVSGIAALARTRWSDRDVYSSRFIMGQIASNTSDGVANAYTALTQAPQPELSYLEHWLFDTTAQAPNNDDDGIVDAGETIDLAIVIRNHWGKADPVSVTLEPWAEGAFQPDPYVMMITDTVNYGAVGSFNIDDNGLIYDAQGVIVGVQYPFRFTTDPDTPNDHVIPFRLTITAGNGYDPADPNAPYTFVSRFYLIVQRGRELPRIISQDMTLTKDHLWLVPNQTLIEAGVTVSVTEGTQLQFWSVDPDNPYAQTASVFFQVEGSFIVRGTADEPVEFFNSPLRFAYPTAMCQTPTGNVDLQYLKIQNPLLGRSPACYGILNRIDAAYINQETSSYVAWPRIADIGHYPSEVLAFDISRTILYKIGSDCLWYDVRPLVLASRYEESLFDSSVLGSDRPSILEVKNSVLLKNSRAAYTRPECSVNENSKLYGSGYGCFGCDEDEGRTANSFRTNAILNVWWDPDVSIWLRFHSSRLRGSLDFVTDNYWGTTSTTLIDTTIHDYYDDFNLGILKYQPILTEPPETAYPFVASIVLSTAAEPDTLVVGAEVVTFTVTFNRDMDTTVEPAVSFGPDVPLTDYSVHPVNGGWQDSRIWMGAFNITPVTGDGYQLIRVAGARAANDPWLVTGDDAGRFRFEIITSGTNAMNLQANGGEGFADLMWTQTDFDLLAGFNLYKATSQAGPYTRLNSTIIPPEQRTWRDTTVIPGQPYYYKFTVIKTDMTESDFSNVATATPIDTIPPVIQHTPLTSATPGLGLTFYADVTDNVTVQSVTLFHRQMGTSTYTSRPMARTTGNRYSATLPGSLVTPPGLEYYIEATDGISTAQDGRPEYPHQVTVSDRPTVTSVTPNRGPATGGTAVTIAGSNFKPGATVTFGGAACGSVTVASSSQITCNTPAHYPTAVDVTVTNPGAQSGTLLNGFTFESGVVSLSLPNTGGRQHAVVQVPINAADVQGMAAASLKIAFDSAVVQALGASTGSLTPGWSLVANTATPGELRLSLASPGGTVSGSGVLATIQFDVVGSPGQVSALTLHDVLLNDGAIPTQTAAGSFQVEQVYDVSGTVPFWNGGVVSGSLLTLTGDRVYTGLSDATGAYTVGGAAADDYVLTASKLDEANGITAYDASLALQHDAGLIVLSGHAASAADVNRSGAITSMDAFHILQKSVDLIGLPFPGAGVVWSFAPPSRSYANLSSNQTGQDFTAVLLGDVSGNWSPGGMQNPAPPENVLTATLSLPAVQIAAGAQATIPLTLSLADGQVYGADLLITYDADVATAIGVTRGNLTAGWGLSSNLATPGEVRIALAGAVPLATGGELLRLAFQATGQPGTSTPLALARGDLNEGNIPTIREPGVLDIVTSCYDFNSSGTVTVADFQIIAAHWQADYVSRYDLNLDGVIDTLDIIAAAGQWRRTCP
ncbi:MAG: S8 family serine peptidase [Anaerolineae bacterium]